MQADARDVGSIPGLGRSLERGHGNPLQYSCLENPWTEEPGGLQSRGVTELDMTEQLTHSGLLLLVGGACCWIL